MQKKCFKCKKVKNIDEYYKHSEMRDGHLNKCKTCTKTDNKTSNGTQIRYCVLCSKRFQTTFMEVKRGGGNCCSRECWYKHFRNIIKKGENSPTWKGDKVGRGIHQWVEKMLGKPKYCEHCKRTDAKIYDWSNKSQKYRRDVSDWQRLCRGCHIKYDYPTKIKKWRESVKKLGWKTKL